MPQFELVLRTAAVLTLLLFATLMLRAGGRDRTGWVGVLCCLAAISFVLTSASNAEKFLGVLIYPLTGLCVAKAALFRLFTRNLFAESFRISLPDIFMVAAVIVWGLWQQLVFIERYRLGDTSGWEILSSAGFEALMIMFVLLAVAEAYQGLSTDLIETRRKTRILFIGGVGAYLAAAVLVQGYSLAFATDTASIIVTANLGLISMLGVLGCWSLVRLRENSWLEPAAAGTARRALTGAEQSLLRSLRAAMEQRRIYRQEGLTINGLAELLGTREHFLRAVINQGLGFRNFNEFLHSYRIREACSRLRHPDEAGLPVLSIALDVGYGSVGPFNRAFRQRLGMTPTMFRQAARSGNSGN